jgi:hypothetical protein
MTVMMVRANLKAESVADLAAVASTMFAAIEKAQPDGVRDAACRIGDSPTFVILLQIDAGIENPLPRVPEFRELQDNLKDWIAEPPSPEQLTVVGSYRLF